LGFRVRGSGFRVQG